MSDAKNIVAVILALALGLSVVIFTAAAAWALDSEHLNLTEGQAALVATVIGGILGALSTYLGVGRSQQLQAPPAEPTAPQTPTASSETASKAPQTELEAMGPGR